MKPPAPLTPGGRAQKEKGYPAWQGSAKAMLGDEYTPPAELFLRLQFDHGDTPREAVAAWRAQREGIAQRQANPAPVGEGEVEHV